MNFPSKHINRIKKLDAEGVRSRWNKVHEELQNKDISRSQLEHLYNIYLDTLCMKGRLTEMQAISLENPYDDLGGSNV